MSSYGATSSNAADAEAGSRASSSKTPCVGSDDQATTALLHSSNDERAPRSSSVRTDFGDERPSKADLKLDAKDPTTRRYMFAGGFLILCLASFVVQTEVSVYIQHELQWEKPYCML